MADFVDGTLVVIQFRYDSESVRLDSFRRQIAARFGLPLTGWTNTYEGIAELKCRGLTITVTGGPTERRADPFVLMLEDSARMAEWEVRQKTR